MRLKLLRLTLRNFKGIREFTLEPNGADCVVYGDNATGKTTLADAYQWLLFGKDSANRADFGIKTLSPDGEAIPGLDHEVEAVFDVDGRRLALRRVLSEKWTKKRGSATATFTGHETTYYVDGVPVKEKEYQARVAAVAPEAVFRLLTDPYHFNRNLSWQERRRILLEVCGDVTDQEVISSDPALAPLSTILQQRSLEDHRKVLQARMSKINAELREIPARIDEATRALPETSANETDLRAQLVELEAKLAERQQALVQVTAGGIIAEIKVALRECEAELQRLRNLQASAKAERVGQLTAKLIEAKETLAMLEAEFRLTENTLRRHQDEIKRLEHEMAILRERWRERNAEELVLDLEPTCPTCGQPLPEEKLAEARERALADFNLAKARDLEEISAKGKRLKAECEHLKAEANSLAAKLDEIEQRWSEAKAEAARLEAQLKAAQDEPEGGYETEIEAALKRRADLEAELERLQAGSREAEEQIRQEIAALTAQVDAVKTELVRCQARKSGLARIEELKAQEKALAAEYERLQAELYLCEQFVRAKVSLLEDKINSKFRRARFKLFEVQVNGGIAETCVTLYKGVPYPDLNGAAKINIGLDVINTLAEHYGFYAPIFVDERESVTDLWPVDTQVISLVVSPKDKVLRVEICGETSREQTRREAIA